MVITSLSTDSSFLVCRLYIFLNIRVVFSNFIFKFENISESMKTKMLLEFDVLEIDGGEDN